MRSDQRAGLLFALAGFAVLSIGDAVVKSMTGLWAPTAIAATRYVLGAAGLAALLWWREGSGALAPVSPKAQLLRGCGVSLATVTFFSSLFFLPLATSTALTFTSPMFTAILAMIVLGEPARRETWIASLAAFAGVLIVLRPNFLAAGWAAVLPLLTAMGMAMLMIGNRLVAGRASPLAMQVYVGMVAAPLLVLATLGFDRAGIDHFELTWPHWSVIARSALVACSASLAHWLIYMGTTRAGAATVAPMTYVQLLVATFLGWLFFDNHPDAMTMLGAAVIVGAGLYLWNAGRVRDVAMAD